MISHFESETRRAERFKVVPYEIPRGCAAAYYPETNVLVPIRDTADGSNQPVSKSLIITIEPTQTPDPRSTRRNSDRWQTAETEAPGRKPASGPALFDSARGPSTLKQRRRRPGTLVRSAAEGRPMLDLSHPFSKHVFRAAGLVGDVLKRGQQMSLAPACP